MPLFSIRNTNLSTLEIEALLVNFKSSALRTIPCVSSGRPRSRDAKTGSEVKRFMGERSMWIEEGKGESRQGVLSVCSAEGMTREGRLCRKSPRLLINLGQADGDPEVAS